MGKFAEREGAFFMPRFTDKVVTITGEGGRSSECHHHPAFE